MSIIRVGSDLAMPLSNHGYETARVQFAALCFRLVKHRPQVLLITSRDTRRWLMPKGWPIDGLSPAECAAREAEEEAGVKGKVLDECLGLFSYSKSMQDAEAIPCIVAVYPLRVTSLATNFPERRQRQRKWFPLEQAALLLQEPEAQTVVSAFAQHALLQVDRAGSHRRTGSA